MICLLWILNTCWLGRAIENEKEMVDAEFVQIPDFAVRVKNLPERSAYKDLD